jgi:regulator of protease activity HflC (stomatin/prohibitin superfamily)
MFAIRFMKANPTTYVIHFQRGKVRREGAGMAFFYYSPTSVLVVIPMASTDVPFAFTENTADFQAVSVQGQLTYRVADPRRLAGLLDFSLTPDRGSYASEDPLRVADRLVQAAQVLTRAFTQRHSLREALVSSDALGAEVLSGLKKADVIAMLGLEVLGLSVLQVRPTPEMARALEAEAREELQRRADQAVYGRRNAAIEEERRIKESELNTQIAVEEKKRVIRETQMEAEIAVEEQRTGLIERKVQNDRKDADSRAYALEETLKPLRSTDWRALVAVASGGTDARLNIALAFRELAENAQKIGELNMTPDLLTSLMGPLPSPAKGSNGK